MSEPPHDEPVGSVADEAAKLFGALSDWAKDHGSDLGQGLSGLATHAVSAAQQVDEHVATGSAECTYCPICRTVHVVRQTSPEVRAHLASAAASLMQAAAGILATAVPDGAGGGRAGPAAGRGAVERIDLDDDGDTTGAWPGEDDA
ncbi:hypothetical protein H5V45_03635 [Nocardioides sp. KIGAM211]|uniref:Uncharacterized protein n=1 Tax=Nocardioides luti TaxID=2761101 RepID=A0A7X0RDN9_9ACTN|nr:hypothetical protein [Nocardioides luti]MBB6626407.1 hypothetical protein [Nocardioides luti]